MVPKALTETGWKLIAAKFKVKDNGLQRALAGYEKLDEAQHDERLKAIAAVAQLAGILRKAKEVVDLAPVVKYLGEVVSAAELQQREIAKAKAVAVKAVAVAVKKTAAEVKASGRPDEGDEGEGEGDYRARLLTLLQKLKGAKDVAFEFAIGLREDEPRFALMLAPKITPGHKKILLSVGGRRLLNLGDPTQCTCRFENGRFTFNAEKPISGLARKLQDSIKHFTGKKFPIAVGAETAEAEGEAAGSQPLLTNASQVWNQTRRNLSANLDQLKAAVRRQFADEAPGLLKEVEQTVKKLDRLLEKFDDKLEASLAKANAAKDTGARKTELAAARSLLVDYIKYVKSEPLIAHIDSNPFGVKTNLRQMLAGSLARMAQALG